MFTVEKSSSHTWTAGKLTKSGKWKPVEDFPTKIEATRHSNKLNREANIPRKHLQDEENQLLLFNEKGR